ncbi:diaminopimelate epimerase [Sedimentibacter acidaminivorans]|uniref:Diaminopimelate epimerase n=1 Tax=Sedimentibacter acidaminivorans TaxID=913099 RepID=A0ABS4GG58_9FIRM|nr:diaminopimelate epimerase [Sedimentibacter acidaminivorans]MBP1926666.1 diaminopimelate epimerase [Sedimentibacter acidaminivorans]
MEFTKIQGAGNDFIIINNMKLKLPLNDIPAMAKKLCTRKVSLGANGFMVVDFPEGDADFKMRFYNSDGSIGEMCGNGARCIARYAYLNNIAGKNMRFETLAGNISAEILEGRLVKVQLNNPEKVMLDHDVEIDGIKYECSYVELGNPGIPHAIVKYPNLENTEESQIFDLGRKIRFYKEFPKGANVNFFNILDDTTAIVKTYERGVEDFTLACGTGSGSTAVALIFKGYLKSNKVKIIVPGGELFIEVERAEDKIEKLFLIGDTNIIAVGQIIDEDLNSIS